MCGMQKISSWILQTNNSQQNRICFLSRWHPPNTCFVRIVYTYVYIYCTKLTYVTCIVLTYFYLSIFCGFTLCTSCLLLAIKSLAPSFVCIVYIYRLRVFFLVWVFAHRTNNEKFSFLSSTRQNHIVFTVIIDGHT